MKIETILGLTTLEPYSHNNHDSASCLVDKETAIGAVSEEVFTKNRHHAGYPWMSVNYLLSLGYSISDIDAIAIPSHSNKPLRNPIRLARMAKRFVPLGFKSFPGNIPHLPIEKKRIIDINHDLAHASAAYRTSGLKKALVITLDNDVDFEEDGSMNGGGIFTANNGELSKLSSLIGGLGMFYSFVTEALGFKALDGESLTMNLAAFGDPNSKAYDVLKKYCPTAWRSKFIKPKKSLKVRSVIVNNSQRYFFQNLAVIYSLIRRFSREDVAAAAQRIVEEQLCILIDNAMEDTNTDNLCLSGEIFLNIKINKKLRELKRVKAVFVYPNPGEPGAAMGAAYEASYNHTNKKYYPCDVKLGPEFSDNEILSELTKYRLKYTKTKDPSGDAAELLSRGSTVGWFQGRMDWSPRSLGSRSVLSSSSDLRSKYRLNQRLKQRGNFMPFAASILEDEAHRYIKGIQTSPYMMMSYDILPHAKEDLGATVHVDGTIRPQTVTKLNFPLLYDLLKEYDKMNAIPALLSTSLKTYGLPIANSPKDAIHLLLAKCVDTLVIGNFVVKPK